MKPPPMTRRLRRGATAIEYALIAVLISVAIIAGSFTIRDALVVLFGRTQTELQGVAGQ